MFNMISTYAFLQIINLIICYTRYIWCQGVTWKSFISIVNYIYFFFFSILSTFNSMCKTYTFSKSNNNNFQMDNLSWKWLKNGLKYRKFSESNFFPIDPFALKEHVLYTLLNIDNNRRSLNKIRSIDIERTCIKEQPFDFYGGGYSMVATV